MGFIKGILGEIHHLIIDVVGNRLAYPLRYTAGNPFFLIAVYEVLPLLLHDRLLLLAHGTPYKIGPAKGIASKVTHYLHNLLLVYYTAVGDVEYGLQIGVAVFYFN